ncbi:MAG: hypothetical protein COV38_07745 [Bdellovibrionales bacterium CG11_big_fil_rev_8_21_14_0_20_38_13]|nr:MAG: hypothetical protein COV38_07745 [Bdellovibrionales bacterium CG11_big_fil_rev_8_21_14_0_20_38_13]
MNYTPVRISTLRPDKPLNFGIYIYFKDQHLLYVKSGDAIEREKFNQLKKQKITKFFIQRDEELNYQQYLDQILTDTLADEGIDLDTKVELVQGTAFVALDRMEKDPKSQISYQMTKTAAKSVARVVMGKQDALLALYEKESEIGEEIVKHSMNVCAICVKMAEILKCSGKEIETISIAALIHDLGLKEEQKLLFNKNQDVMSSADKIIYNKHTKEGLNEFVYLDWISKEVLELAQLHEENLTGTGPYKKTKLSKLEEILSLVNAYDKQVMISGLKPLEVIKEFKLNGIGKYDLKMIQALERVIKIGFV